MLCMSPYRRVVFECRPEGGCAAHSLHQRLPRPKMPRWTTLGTQEEHRLHTGRRTLAPGAPEERLHLDQPRRRNSSAAC